MMRMDMAMLIAILGVLIAFGFALGLLVYVMIFQ